MEWWTLLFNAELHWRAPIWLWGLGLPILWWWVKRSRRHFQKNAYADAALWPWVSGTVLQSSLQKDAQTQNAHSSKLTRPGYFWVSILHAMNFINQPSRLLTIAWLCLLIALAGPRSLQPDSAKQIRAGVDILVSMDLSHSMTANDVYPNRFLFAKSLVETLKADLQPTDRLALSVFAGRAHTVSPLSFDRGLFQHALDLMEPDLLPTQGSWLDLALIDGLHHLSQTGGNAKVLLIFTDGAPAFWKPVTLPTDVQGLPFVTEKRSSQTGIKIILVGVGLLSATTLADSSDASGKLHANGLLVQSRLEETQLKKVAQQVEGVYLRADASEDFIQHLIDTVTMDAGSRAFVQPELIWQDHAWPFMALGGLTLLWAFYGFSARRTISRTLKAVPDEVLHSQLIIGLLVLLLAIGSLYGSSALAEELVLDDSVMADSAADDEPGQNLSNTFLASQRPATLMQWAYEAYQQQQYDDAQALYDQVADYEGWFGAGAAAYRAENYESAVSYFSQAAVAAPDDLQRAMSLFNLGNSYYQVNLLPQAIEAYQQALLYQPNYPKANHNLSLAQQRKMIEDQGQLDAKKSAGDDEGGSQGRDGDGAFYGGQKPKESDSDEPGTGGDGNGIDGERGGKTVILPQTGEMTDYELNSQPFATQLSDEQRALQASGNAILEQQKRQQRIDQFEQQLQQLDDDQKTLLKRLFEREEGFDAPQSAAHPIPGIQPW